METDAVIVAAGSSTRFGADKLFAPLCGAPVLAWSLRAFAAAECIRSIVVVTAPASAQQVIALALAEAGPKLLAVVPGGERRRDSVEAGLRAVSARYAAIHDGARPLVTSTLIEAVVAAADGIAGAIPAIPVTDTIKTVSGGIVFDHLDRSMLRAAQTPQVVLRQAWLDAASAGDSDETDDAAMLGRFNLDIAVVDGDPENLKITRPADLDFAASILRDRGVTS